MCTRFVYNGKETIVGFNFDIDLSEWEHTVIAEKDRFFIGIKKSRQAIIAASLLSNTQILNI